MTEVAQEYEGTVTVATSELNPHLISIFFEEQNIHESNTLVYANDAIQESVLLDIGSYVFNLFGAEISNTGDELIDCRVELILDGVTIFDLTAGVPPTGVPTAFYTPQDLSAYISAGSHTAAWRISARRYNTSDAFVEYYNDSVTYYCYTLGLDAIATQVGFVQNGIEKNWLTWTGAEFVQSAILIEPDTATTTRFHFSNMGDESVRMYVGNATASYPRWDINEDGIVDELDQAILEAHWGEVTYPPYPRYDINEDGVVDQIDLAILSAHWGETYTPTGQYDTGIVIDGVVYDTVQPYVDIVAGGTGTLDVINYVPTASFTISFAILRERLL